MEMASTVKVQSVDNYSEPSQKVLDYVRIQIVNICSTIVITIMYYYYKYKSVILYFIEK